MKKLLMTMGLSLAVASVSVSAEDALKKSLLPGETKPKPAVNLDALSVGAKPMAPKTRPASAVIATVDGIPIKKGKADEFLKMASKGKVGDIDLLPKKQRDALIKGMAATVLIEEKAKKEVPEEIKNKLAAQFWVGQEMKKVTVSDEEAKKFYEKNKKVFKDKDGKELPYEKVENYVKMQLKQKKFNEQLMKNAKVVIK